jgi:hypothetical protein
VDGRIKSGHDDEECVDLVRKSATQHLGGGSFSIFASLARTVKVP